MAMVKKISFDSKDIEKIYRNQALKYSNFARESFSWRYLEKPLLDKFLKNIHIKNPKILDAGCGEGRVLKYLLDKGISKENIIGIDISSEMLAISNKLVPEIKTFKSDLRKFKSRNKFNVIISTHVLHYFDRNGLKKAMKNFHKLLKPGGILFFVITHPIRTTRRDLTKYFKRGWIIDHTPWGTISPLFLRPVSDIVNETINAGFNILSIEEPEVSLAAKKSDSANYLKYSCAPSRIAVVATKSGI